MTYIMGLSILLVVMFLMMRKKDQVGNRTVDPLAEAEVYLVYGRKEEAREILEKFLLAKPGHAKAIELLSKAQ